MNWVRTRPTWLWITAVATLAYLAVELSFNARLLDVIGGNATDEEIDGIQSWGRMISGFAVALAFWPLLIKALVRRTTIPAATIMLALITVVVIFAVYHTEKRLIDSLASESTASQKSKAGDLLLLQKAVKDGQVNLAGLNMEDAQAPAAKAFLAVFPVLVLHIDDLEEKIATDKHRILRAQVLKQHGGKDGSYENYKNSLRDIWATWNMYAEASNAYDSALASIPEAQTIAWNDYTKQLREESYSPNTVPFYGHGAVRKRLWTAGVPVSKNWKSNDRAGFYRAVEKKGVQQARELYDFVLKAAGPEFTGLEPGLGLTKFAANDKVDAKWRAGLGYPNGVKLKAYTINRYPTQEEFNSDIFEKVIAEQIADQASVLDADESTFEISGRYYENGVTHVRSLIAPTIALTFSFLGAIVHIFKLGALIAQLFAANPIRTWMKFGAVVAAATSVVLIFSVLLSTTITRSELYVDLHEVVARGRDQKGNAADRLAATLIRGAINAQPALYAVSQRVSPLINRPSFGIK